MEKVDRKSLTKILNPSNIIWILPYFGYAHESLEMMRKLNKSSRATAHKFEHVFMNKLVKKEIKLCRSFEKKMTDDFLLSSMSN